MGDYTFAEFKDYTAFHMGQRSDVQTAGLLVGGSTEMYGVWFNAAYRQLTSQNRLWELRLSKEWVFPELKVVDTSISTVDGTATITTPTDALIVYHLWNKTSDLSLKNITFAEYLERSGRANTSSEGKPTEWVRYGTTIYLYPTPDAVYNTYVYYRKRPAELTGTAVTAIGAEWDEPLLYLAIYKGLMATDHMAKAQVFKDDFIDMATGIIGIYDQEERARDTHISPNMLHYKENLNL